MKLAILLLFFAASAQAQDIFVPQLKRAEAVQHAALHKPAPKSVKAFRYPTTEFEVYRGPQSRDWPLTDKPAWTKAYAVPIYLATANKPFDIVGTVYVHIPPPGLDNPREAAMTNAALVAKSHGADALILKTGVEYLANVCYATGTAIRWAK